MILRIIKMVKLLKEIYQRHHVKKTCFFSFTNPVQFRCNEMMHSFIVRGARTRTISRLYVCPEREGCGDVRVEGERAECLVEHAQVEPSTTGGIAGGPAAQRAWQMGPGCACHVLLERSALGACRQLRQQRVPGREQPIWPAGWPGGLQFSNATISKVPQGHARRAGIPGNILVSHQAPASTSLQENFPCLPYQKVQVNTTSSATSKSAVWLIRKPLATVCKRFILAYINQG